MTIKKQMKTKVLLSIITAVLSFNLSAQQLVKFKSNEKQVKGRVIKETFEFDLLKNSFTYTKKEKSSTSVNHNYEHGRIVNFNLKEKKNKWIYHIKGKSDEFVLVIKKKDLSTKFYHNLGNRIVTRKYKKGYSTFTNENDSKENKPDSFLSEDDLAASILKEANELSIDLEEALDMLSNMLGEVNNTMNTEKKVQFESQEHVVLPDTKSIINEACRIREFCGEDSTLNFYKQLLPFVFNASDSAQFYAEMGWYIFLKKEYSSAKIYLEKALEMGYESDYLYNNLANTYYELNNRTKACNCWNKAIELDYTWRDYYKTKFGLEKPWELYQKYCNKY